MPQGGLLVVREAYRDKMVGTNQVVGLEGWTVQNNLLQMSFGYPATALVSTRPTR